MKTGTTVRLIQPVVQGVVKERRITPADEIELLVEWTEADGQTAERWFNADQLEAVKETAP